MGLSTKHVVADDHQEIDQSRLQSSAAELPKPPSSRRQQPPTETLNCPRCGSRNTKFCYYNNYNKSQPRHFCKSCKRHWTKGGTLRNVPLGGARKNKRSKISSPTTTAATATHCQNINDNSSDHQKSMSNILYQALIRSSSPLLDNNTTDSVSISIPGKPFNIESTATNGSSDISDLNIPNSDQILPFSCLQVSTASLNIPSSYDHDHPPILNANDQYHLENFDTSVEESSTITAVNGPNSSSSPLPWLSSDMDLISDYNWNWNEVDVFSSSDLNIAWSDDGDGLKFRP